MPCITRPSPVVKPPLCSGFTTLNNKQIKTYKIERHKQHLIRKELAVLGIDYSVLFPGIDGVCKSINDRLIFELEMEALPF